ncbi:MAG: hypothetical protein KGM42_05785 [Hyphomicrobiales bacterium]|nr:hypothetical protein [Hyphomicrobiales bacterium]
MSAHRFGRAIALALALTGLAPGAGFARPQVPAEQRHMSFSGDMPACDDPSILGRISSRFASREGHYWDSGLAIAAFQGVVEVGYRPNGLDYYPRRYCSARAVLNDGKTRKVTYAIGGRESGWLGVLGNNVDWCVEGLDRNLAYGAQCRAARP